jgi:hypothetical protein
MAGPGALLLLVLASLLTQAAQAAEATISASYRGDASGRFENTTPPAEFCSEWSFLCSAGDSTTVELPIAYTKETVQGTGDNRDLFYFRMPPSRDVTVTNTSTGDNYKVTFQFTEFSQQLQWISGVRDPMPVMGAPQSGCSLVVNTSMKGRARFVWSIKNPLNPQECWTRTGTSGDTTVSAVSKTGIKYRLIMPRPIGMPQGTYRGSARFTMGPGAELDFGHRTDFNDRMLTVHFELSVEHDLYVIWPAGTERAVLEPPGGWQAWLGGRGRPARLSRDIPLRMWSTGPFKVYKRCAIGMGQGCAIRNQNGHQVPIGVSLSLPGNIQHAGGAARKVALPTGMANAPVFEPQQILLNHPGQLTFEVTGNDLDSMLGEAGTTYEGEVTVVFDAEL